jgi:hypothetical protein
MNPAVDNPLSCERERRVARIIAPDCSLSGGNDQLTNEIVGQLLQEMDIIQTMTVSFLSRLPRISGILSPQVKDYILKYQTHRSRLVCRISRGDSARDPVQEADRCCLWTCCSTRQIDTSPSPSWLIMGLNPVAWMLQYTS